ncbi:SRPBCC family protein [Neiella marina]|uniref:SRPBCC family protein n=1 Tax=Neiella holothuriorum TaxID=2870530 RepID=A0ABS7EGR4_9GAMM|nr:SRPBCC family protein [Neiella holothuriorum]MBW8191544.1 SRPBCC family protein [Neiella holothuriorum]
MKTILKSFFALWIIVLITGLFLPNNYEIKRSTIVTADLPTLHAYVVDLEQWQEWSPWLDADPTIVVTLGQITHGAGASQTWQGESGDGELLLTKVSEQVGVNYDIWFNQKADKGSGAISYVPLSDGRIEVIWSMEGEIATPIFGAYLALFMDGMVGPSFDLGLYKLKSLAETGAIH